MNPSFIQHAFGPNALVCHRIEYRNNSIYLHVQTRPDKLVCPVCGSQHVVKYAVKKGLVYKTIVVDLDSDRIIYVGDGKGKDSLVKFWKKVKTYNVYIEHVSSDLSLACTSSIMENAPKTIHVFDHFHIVKLMNEAPDDIRRVLWREEKDLNKRKVIKGTRWLLLANGSDIFDSCHKNRLENALKLNEPLTKAYYLKEDLREIWYQPDKVTAEAKLNDWIKQAQDSGLKQLRKMAGTLMVFWSGILVWYDCHISNGKVEGINNKIKVMKRRDYGFRDDRYLVLRLYALHDSTNANVG